MAKELDELNEGEIKKRLYELESAIQTQPSIQENWVEYCELLELLDVPAETVIEAWENAYVSCNESAQLRFFLAAAHGEFGSLKRAEGLLSSLDTVESKVALADAYLRHGFPEKAAESAEIAIGLEPNFDEAHKFMGIAHRSLGDFVDAERFLKSACELDRNCCANWQELGELLLELNRSEEAYEALSNAVELEGKTGWTRLWFAQSCWDTERFDEAEKAFKEALIDFPEFPKAHEWYAEFLNSLGREEEAAHHRKLASIKSV